MSVTRRSFFKGLVAGLGSLGLANVILSKQGWLRFLQSGKAHADIPGPPFPTYTLNPRFQFFQGEKKTIPRPQRDGAGDNPTNNAIGKWNAFAPIAQIIEYNSANPNSQRSIVRVYDLSASQAFVTRLLLMGVDTNTLIEMYVSRFRVPRPNATSDINSFIRNNTFFQPTGDQNPGLPQIGPIRPRPYSGTIWADFSMGSVYGIGVIKYP